MSVRKKLNPAVSMFSWQKFKAKYKSKQNRVQTTHRNRLLFKQLDVKQGVFNFKKSS